jgi:hypothetical protein
MEKRWSMNLRKKLQNEEKGIFIYDCLRSGKPKENDERIRTDCPFSLHYFRQEADNKKI